MSEIKGQLLGIIIVLMVFAAVGGTMVAVFSRFSGSIETTVNQVVDSELAADYTVQTLDSEGAGEGGTSRGI